MTKSEIAASEALKERHKVALYNKQTGIVVMAKVTDINHPPQRQGDSPTGQTGYK